MYYSSVTALVVTWAPSVLSCTIMLLRVWYTSWRLGRWVPTFSELLGLISVAWLLAANSVGAWLIAQELKYNVSSSSLTGYISLALLHPDILRRYFQGAFANTASYYCLAWLFKAMFLSTFWGLQTHFESWLRWTFRIVVGWNVAAFLTTILALFSWCRPLSRAWANPITGRWCNFQAPHFILIGLVCNVTSDLLIFTFAAFLVRTLSMRRSEFWATAFVFSIGAISIAACVVRFTMIWSLSAPGGINAQVNLEHGSIVWTEVELVTGQIAACLPSFRVAVRKWMQNWKERGGRRGACSNFRSRWRLGEGGDVGGIGGEERKAEKWRSDEELAVNLDSGMAFGSMSRTQLDCGLSEASSSP